MTQRAFTIDFGPVIDPIECVLAHGAILADPLDVQKTSAIRSSTTRSSALWRAAGISKSRGH
jgi:hypothetical protein